MRGSPFGQNIRPSASCIEAKSMWNVGSFLRMTSRANAKRSGCCKACESWAMR